MRNVWLALVSALLIVASVRAAIAHEDDEVPAGLPPQFISHPNKGQIEPTSRSVETGELGLSTSRGTDQRFQ